MKILLLNDFGTLQGGAEAQLAGLREVLRKRGHQVRLLTSRAGYGDLPLLSDYLCFGTTTPLRAVTQVVNPSAYRELRRVLNSFRPDVVHGRVLLWQLSPVVLAALGTVPMVFNPADYKTACPTAKKILPDGEPCVYRRGLECLRRGCCRTAPQWALEMLQGRIWERCRSRIDRVVAQSQGAKQQLERLGLPVDEVIHNGVAERAPRPPLSEPPLIAFAGRLSPEKGVQVLLRAFQLVVQSVPGVRLSIVGSGPERPSIERLARELGVGGQIELAGHLQKAEMENRLERAWVQAVPSLWHEPFPNVATEAMMRGTAVVASHMGGLPEIVEPGETGYLVPARDVPALAGALTEIVADRGLAERLGEAGRWRALRLFSMESSASRFEKLYAGMLK